MPVATTSKNAPVKPAKREPLAPVVASKQPSTPKSVSGGWAARLSGLVPHTKSAPVKPAAGPPPSVAKPVAKPGNAKPVAKSASIKPVAKPPAVKPPVAKPPVAKPPVVKPLTAKPLPTKPTAMKQVATAPAPAPTTTAASTFNSMEVAAYMNQAYQDQVLQAQEKNGDVKIFKAEGGWGKAAKGKARQPAAAFDVLLEMSRIID